MKLLNGLGCLFPDSGGNEVQSEIADYDSRRTGNGLLDTGSTPVWSTFLSNRKFLVISVRSNEFASLL